MKDGNIVERLVGQGLRNSPTVGALPMALSRIHAAKSVPTEVVVGPMWKAA